MIPVGTVFTPGHDSSGVSHASYVWAVVAGITVALISLYYSVGVDFLAAPIVGWFQQVGPAFGRAARMERLGTQVATIDEDMTPEMFIHRLQEEVISQRDWIAWDMGCSPNGSHYLSVGEGDLATIYAGWGERDSDDEPEEVEWAVYNRHGECVLEKYFLDEATSMDVSAVATEMVDMAREQSESLDLCCRVEDAVPDVEVRTFSTSNGRMVFLKESETLEGCTISATFEFTESEGEIVTSGAFSSSDDGFTDILNAEVDMTEWPVSSLVNSLFVPVLSQRENWIGSLFAPWSPLTLPPGCSNIIECFASQDQVNYYWDDWNMRCGVRSVGDGDYVEIEYTPNGVRVTCDSEDGEGEDSVLFDSHRDAAEHALKNAWDHWVEKNSKSE